jgi:hypothetical protein
MERLDQGRIYHLPEHPNPWPPASTEDYSDKELAIATAYAIAIRNLYKAAPVYVVITPKA